MARSLGSPLYSLLVYPPATAIELAKKRLMFIVPALISPLPAPNKNMSIKIPQATAKPVSAVRSLLRRVVDHISSKSVYIIHFCG